jgi:nitroimidazol reductase NimA-like FMN-containing flavoprotein (pyridoxamine 5'-phosphate oxidase superfamily)
MPHGENAAQPLGRDTCLRLLRSVVVGRVAWADNDGRVTVLPVNFVVDGDFVVFRTAEGGKLAAVQERRLLSFEGDDVEPGLQTGWSVLVSGTAQVVTDTATIDRLERLPLAPWLSMPQSYFVRLCPEEITGRRLPLHPGGGTHERIGPDDDSG